MKRLARPVSHAPPPLRILFARDKMAARAGIEPATKLLQVSIKLITCESGESGNSQIDSHKLAQLVRVVEAWSGLPPSLRAAVLAVVQSAERGNA